MPSRVSLELEQVMPRKQGPALYELMGKGNRPARNTSNGEVPEEIDENLSHNVLAPGQSFRFSIGTIGVCVAVVIALLAMVYTMGYNRGQSIAKEDYGSRLLEGFVEPDVEAQGSKQMQQQQPNAILDAKPPSKPQWGPIESDPRESGRYYFTLMQTTASGAHQLAGFCREKGLETYAISGHNTRSYRVIALPGFVDRNGAIAVSLRTQIEAIGRQWAQLKASGGSNLQDAYPSLYNE